MDLPSLAIKVSRSENIGVLGPAVTKILKLAPDPAAGANALEDALNLEPALMARVLKAANSPLYALRNPASTVSAAVMVLGMKAVQSLVVGAAYTLAVSDRSQVANFDQHAYWVHSLAVAIAAKKLAIAASRFDAEDFYTMGMLHEVGMLALEKHCPKEWDRVLLGARTTKLPLHLVETKLLSFSHRDAGVVMLEKWGMDERITETLRHLHNPPFEHKHGFEIGLLSVADVVAHQAGFKSQSPDVEVEFDSICLDLLGLEDEPIEKLIETLPGEVADAELAYTNVK